MKNAGKIIPIILLFLLLYLVGMIIGWPNISLNGQKDSQGMQHHDKTYFIHGNKNLYIHTVSQDERLSEESRQRIIERASDVTDDQIQFGIIYADSFIVSSNYKPYPYFYVMLEKTGNVDWGILSVEGGALRLDFYQKEAFFEGELSYKIEDNAIKWHVNGKFAGNGAMKLTHEKWEETEGSLMYEMTSAPLFNKKAEGSGICPLNLKEFY